MVSIEPIVTLAIDKSMLHTPEPTGVMVWIDQALTAFGIPHITINGQIMPGTMILLILATWGAWHMAIMGYNAVGALPQIHEKMKKFTEKKK